MLHIDGWMVIRDSECDQPEFFLTEDVARSNACLGVVRTSVHPLIRAAVLHQALLKYAKHLPSCRKNKVWIESSKNKGIFLFRNKKERQAEPCTCGLDDFLME